MKNFKKLIKESYLGNPLNEATDFNDPALIKSRAAQMKRDKIEDDEEDKQAYLDKKYGSNFMDKLDAEIGLKTELQDLKDEREQLVIDMEQEAEPEGGEVADLYGMKLNRIDLRTAEIKSELDDLRMYESVNEESEGDKEIRALEKEAKKYPKIDSRYMQIQKKIGNLKSDKDYALPGSKADKKFSDMNEDLNENEDEKRNTTFFYPSEETFSRKYDVINLLPYEFKGGNRANAVDGLTVLKVTSTDPDRHAQKYGIPSDKEIEAYKMVDKALWNFKRTIPSMAYDKYDFYRYGNGAASDMGFVYSPKNGFEFYLNMPREIRQPDEYGNVPQEDIDVFDKITSGMMDIANKVEAMGFKTSLNSTPEGYKGSLNEEFKKGDKVTYLGHPAVVTATKEYNGRDFVSVSYDKGNGATKARMILVKSGDVKAVKEGTCGYGEDGKIGDTPAGPDLNEMEDSIPAFMMRDGMYRELVDDSINYNDFEKRIYGFVGPKYYKMIHSEHPGALKNFYDKFRVTNPNLEEESDTDVGGGAKQAIGLDIDDEGASDAALDNEVNKMGYNESKGFDFKKIVKEALTPKNLR